jgi:hypothetical protein
MATAKPKALKKITVRDVIGGKVPVKQIPEHGEELHLCDIYGQARRLITGETDYGPYVKFKGSFEGVAAWGDKAGEIFRAPNCILPDVAADELENMLTAAGVSAVNFAYRISIVGDEQSNIGYFYKCEQIMDTDQADPLDALRLELAKSGAIAALPKPDEKSDETGKGKNGSTGKGTGRGSRAAATA